MIKSILGTLRAIHRLLIPYPTFVADIGVVGSGAGYAAELLANGERLRVKSVWFSKPSAQVTLRLIRAATASSGGTSTQADVIGMKGGVQSSARLLLFTAVPTAGTALGDVFEMVVGTGDNVEVLFGDDGTEPLEIEGRQALAVNVSAAATIVGRIVFQQVSQ